MKIRNLISKLENTLYWSILGFTLTLLFGFVGLYSFFHERAPSISFEIIGESNVLDLHKPLEELTIYFNNEDIQKKNLNLRLLSFQMTNNGEMHILQSDYDEKMKWGVKLINGQIINVARLVGSNSEYLKDHLHPKVIGTDVVEFEKVIFEKEKYFVIEILVLHDKNVFPELKFIGKIAGIDQVLPIKTWEKKQKPSFLETFFYGGPLINVLRVIVSIFFIVLLSIILGVILDALAKRNTKKNMAKLKIELDALFGEEPRSEVINCIVNTYKWGGVKYLQELEEYLKEEEIIIYELKALEIEQQASSKLMTLKEEMVRNLSLEEDDLSPSLSYDPFTYQRLLKNNPSVLNDLFKMKIIYLDKQGEVKIDSEFRKILSMAISKLKMIA